MTLTSEHTKKNYSCSQSVLYAALRLCWEEYKKRQQHFAPVATHYTMEYANQQLAAVQVAENMPDHEVRSNIHELLYQNLGHVTDQGLVNYKFLESHILRAFPTEQHDMMLQDAGKSHYRKATNHDWESASTLLNMSSLFITNHLNTLKAGGMPDSFVNVFNTGKTNFDSVYVQFLDSEEEVWKMREDKIIANNAVYNTTMAMMKDGQKIFRYDEAIKKMFVFSHAVELIQTGGGTAEPSIKIKSNQKISKPGINFGARLLGVLKILWGDGTFVDFTGDPNATNFIDKTYTLLKIYTIIITGKIGEIVELHISNSNLTYIKLHKSMKKLEQFIAQNNMFTTKVVDDILITINKYGTSGPGRVINLLGSEPPSAKGLAAKAELEARGWMVLVAS